MSHFEAPVTKLFLDSCSKVRHRNSGKAYIRVKTLTVFFDWRVTACRLEYRSLLQLLNVSILV